LKLFVVAVIRVSYLAGHVGKFAAKCGSIVIVISIELLWLLPLLSSEGYL